MKSLIQTISQLIVENSEQKAFNSKEIALFKFLNKNKGSLQTKADYKKFITIYIQFLFYICILPFKYKKLKNQEISNSI
jgi:hypothetical protein